MHGMEKLQNTNIIVLLLKIGAYSRDRNYNIHGIQRVTNHYVIHTVF
jgi:hypothetical protein